MQWVQGMKTALMENYCSCCFRFVWCKKQRWENFLSKKDKGHWVQHKIGINGLISPRSCSMGELHKGDFGLMSFFLMIFLGFFWKGKLNQACTQFSCFFVIVCIYSKKAHCLNVMSFVPLISHICSQPTLLEGCLQSFEHKLPGTWSFLPKATDLQCPLVSLQQWFPENFQLILWHSESNFDHKFFSSMGCMVAVFSNREVGVTFYMPRGLRIRH